MKKNSSLLFGSTVLLFLLWACNKPVYKYNSDFEGRWRTIPVYDTNLDEIVGSEIIIEGADGAFNSTCLDTCSENLCNCLTQQSGKAVMNSSKTEMKIGSSSTYSLTVDEEPNIDTNNVWTMKIEGLRYYKVP